MQFFFSPNGRIGRLYWWVGSFVPLGLILAGLIVAGALVGDNIETASPSSALLALGFMFIFFCASLWVSFCLTAKRYHDRDKSAFWFLIYLVPIIGPIWQIVECGFLPGSPGGNSYGADESPGWSDVDAEIAAMRRAQRDGTSTAQSPAMREKPAPAKAVVQGSHRAPAGFGRRGVQA